MTFPAPAPTPTPRYYKNLGGNNMDGHLTCLESRPSFRPPLLAAAVILAPWVHLPTSEKPYRYRYRYLGTENKKTNWFRFKCTCEHVMAVHEHVNILRMRDVLAQAGLKVRLQHQLQLR